MSEDLQKAELEPFHDRMRKTLQSIQNICTASKNVSQFFPFGGQGYKNSVQHYLESSADIAYAAVRPGRVEDVADILRILSETKVPFAIKGGGHTSNPHFSSTKGIQIAMTRFNEITYDPQTHALTVGAGCLFDEIYRYLKPLNRNIVGGSAIAGVGVVGYLLGGDQPIGLGIDNILGIRIVLPNGLAEDASANKNPILFEAIKGGGNNFGIVVQFTLKTHPQPLIYGDVLEYKLEKADSVKTAVVNFIENCKEPKAAIVAAFRYYNNPGGQTSKLTVQYFYDGPKPEPDPFKEFLEIGHGSLLLTGKNGGSNDSRESSYFDYDQLVSTLNDSATFDFNEYLKRGHESLESFIKPDAAESALSINLAPPPTKPMAGVGEHPRGRWGNVMVSKYTSEVINEVEKQAKEASKDMVKHSGKTVIVDIWPFLPQMFDNSSPAAWPHKKGESNGPLLVLFLWEGQENDEFWISKMKSTLQALEDKVNGKGVLPTRPVYINTTLSEHTSVQQVYRENLRLYGTFRKKVDPGDVMGLAGGFRIPSYG